MRPLIVLALAGLALGGCSLAPHYTQLKAIAEQGVETGIQDRKDYNDLKSEVLVALPCDAPLGAVMRISDARKKAIIIELCGGPAADSQVTVEDMAAMMRVLNEPQ